MTDEFFIDFKSPDNLSAQVRGPDLPRESIWSVLQFSLTIEEMRNRILVHEPGTSQAVLHGVNSRNLRGNKFFRICISKSS